MAHDEAVKAVTRFLRERGHQVAPTRKTNSNGPDIVILMDHDAARIEVKVAMEHPKKRHWRVRQVEPSRRGDDFVALVFPGGHIHFERMLDWLEHCNEDGSRTVTALAALVAVPQKRLRAIPESREESL